MFDKQLHDLVLDIFQDSLEVLASLEVDNKPIPNHSGFQTIAYYQNSLPNFELRFSDQPRDYGKAVRDYGHLTDNDASYRRLAHYFENNDRLKHYFLYTDKMLSLMSPHWVRSWISGMIESYCYAHKGFAFDNELFGTIYSAFEMALYVDKLPIRVLVPISYITFDFDQQFIAPGLSIERMTDDLQQARYRSMDTSDRDASTVAKAASHALMFDGWEITNTNYFQSVRSVMLHQQQIDMIEKIFAILRIAFEVDIGYAQFVAVPLGWRTYTSAHLPMMASSLTHNYPNKLLGLSAESANIPHLSGQDVSIIAQYFEKIEQIKKSNLFLAIRRLNSSYLRVTEEDAILDLTIGLEALLSDGNTEIVHKLALRLAALSKISSSHRGEAINIFRDTKSKIYTYRSKVVHGQSTDKKRGVIKNGTEIPVVTLGIEYLRMALQVLIENPRYFEVSKIDEDLLLADDNSGRIAKIDTP